MANVKKTQKQKILDHLKMFKTITPLEAMKEYGCMRLAAVVYKLKEEYAISFKDIWHDDLTLGELFKVVKNA